MAKKHKIHYKPENRGPLSKFEMMEISRIKLDDEEGRLAALHRYDELDGPSDMEFRDILTLIKSVFSVPFAAINLIDQNYQFMKAAVGMEPIICPREDSFCTHTVCQKGILEVEDALLDARFMHNPFVTGMASIRSYLGVPLTTPDGYNIGALCVFGTEPRAFSEAERDVLANFATVVMTQLELRQAIRRDTLTGSMTRRAFQGRMNELWCRESEAEACLIMLDIDHFKCINDTFGHPVGDQVLRQITTCLSRCIRSYDSLGRMGGEEFGILLPRTGGKDALMLASRLRDAVAVEPFSMMDGRHITISLGVAEYRIGESPEDCLARADAALYEAKHSGRNRVVLFREAKDHPDTHMVDGAPLKREG